MSRARKPRSVAIELPHSGARARRRHELRHVLHDHVFGLGQRDRATARTSSVSPDFACMSRTNSTMLSSTSSGAWITTSTPSPRTLRSGSVTSAATSISASRSGRARSSHSRSTPEDQPRSTAYASRPIVPSCAALWGGRASMPDLRTKIDLPDVRLYGGSCPVSPRPPPRRHMVSSPARQVPASLVIVTPR